PANPSSRTSRSPPSIGARPAPRRTRSSISTSPISNRSEGLAMENTQRVVDFVVGARFEDVPEQALAVARSAMLDCIGVALAGARQPAGLIAAEWAKKAAGKPQATVWGQGFRTSAHDAALANGTAAHALDYDDVTWGLIGHPSVSLVPSVLALGEQVGA